MADQATEKMQNMNIQDYDSSEFDPLSPQNCKSGNFPYTDTQEVDLLGDFGGGVTNGHGKTVMFDEAALGLPVPACVGPTPRSNQELLQRHMSEGEILGYQNEYGESVTHQMEYGLDSDDEDDDENNLVDFGDSQNGPVTYPGPPVDQDYLMSTGQPLVDFVEDQQTLQPISDQQDLLSRDNFDDYSSQALEQYQNQEEMDDNEYFDSGDPNYAQEQVENDFKTDDVDPNNWQPEMETEKRGVDQSEHVEDNWHPQMDTERSRRSRSPERSLSPPRDNTYSEGAEGVSSPQCDTESYDNYESEDISSVSDSHQESKPMLPKPAIPHSDAEHSDRSQADQWESDSVTSDASGKFRSGVPRPRKIKKPKELPPWNDNVVLPKQPRVRPTFIGNKEYLPTASSSPDRPKTAPVHFVAKDASSDSGVEDDKNTRTQQESGESKKKYGTDTKNDRYKPGGGKIQIFNQKVDTKHVAGRTDTKTPKTALTPRSPVKSPSLPRAQTPNTKQVQSKIGSLNNVKHNPGGGNVQILSAKPDFSNVRSKVGSKDKLSHKPQGGDKKIESRKLDWKTESKVGSMKNATHHAGGGNIKDSMPQVQATMNTRENIDYTPGGGHVPEPWEEELDWEAEAQVNSLDNLHHVPAGGKVKIFSEKLHWDAEAKVDTGLQRRNEKIGVLESFKRYDSSRHEVAVDIEGSRYSQNNIQDYVDEPVNQTGTLNGQEDGLDGLKPNDIEIPPNKPPSLEAPPPKPPRCKHKQWEIEYLRGKRENDEDEIHTGRDQHSDMQNLHEAEIAESRNSYGIKIQRDEITVLPQGLESIEEENLKSDDSIIHSEHVVSHSTEREDETGNNVQERIEAFTEIESQTSVKMSETSNGKPDSIAAKKPGIGSRIKGMMLPKKTGGKIGADNKGTKLRFSSTSKVISKANSEVGQKETEEEEGEEALMAKYLGYVGPKLLKKGDKADKASADPGKIDAKKQPIHKDDKSEMEKKAVEKLANLGYESPKLARKSNDVVMTGSKKNQVERQTTHGRVKGLVKKMSEKISNYGNSKQISSGADKEAGEKCRQGVSNRLQDKDTAVKGRLTGSYKVNEYGTDSGEMFDYDMDSDVDTDEEREISYAEISVNQDQKPTQQLKPIQTTTYNYKLDKRPSSPYHTFKQEMIESIKSEYDKGSLKDETVNAEIASKQVPEVLPVVHDKFGYSLVNKGKNSVNESSLVEISKGESQLNNQGNMAVGSLDPTVFKASGGEISMEDDKELSLEEELRSVLASLGDGETKILKAPQKYEGTQLGSRPGTPKISVKPIRLKYEEEARRLEYSRSFSSKDSVRGQQSGPFDRSQRCQSMILKRTQQMHMFGEKGASVGRAHTRRRLDKEEKENIVARGLQAGIGDMTEEHTAEKFDYRSKPKHGSNKISAPSNILKTSGFMQGNANNMIAVGIGGMRYEEFRGTSLKMPLRASDMCMTLLPKSCHRKICASNIRDLIESHRTTWSASSRIGSLHNATHVPGGGKKKILDQKVEVKAHSKIGSTANLKHRPGGGDKKIETVKLDFTDKAKSKVGSMDKVHHRPGGGDIKVFKENLSWNTSSKVESLKYVKHVPGGGDVKVFTQNVNWYSSSRVKSLENLHHMPGGGDIKVIDEKLKWDAASKVESLVNVKHVPGGGEIKILDEKVDYSETAKSKVGSMDKVKHTPGGGDKKIETQKLSFKESAKARTDTGGGSTPSRSHDSHSRSDSVTSSQDGSVQE